MKLGTKGEDFAVSKCTFSQLALRDKTAGILREGQRQMSVGAGSPSSSGAPEGLRSWQKRGMVPRSWGRIMDMQHVLRTGSCTKEGKRGENPTKKSQQCQVLMFPSLRGFQPCRRDHR